MKQHRLSVVLSVLLGCFLASVAHAQSLPASAAVVLSVDPSGAEFELNGATAEIMAGSSLGEGGTLSTGESTVVLALANGTRITVDPGTEMVLSTIRQSRVNKGAFETAFDLKKGKLLIDSSGVPFGASGTTAVDTRIGRTVGSGGVYSISMADMDTGFSLDINNVDAEVSLTPSLDLDVSKMQTTAVEPGKPIMVPTGESITIRGFIIPELDRVELREGSVVMADIPSSEIQDIREATQEMSSIDIPEAPDAPAVTEDTVPVIGDDDEGVVVIEIPVEDVETASDKG
jgi:hypothetical protein